MNPLRQLFYNILISNFRRNFRRTKIVITSSVSHFRGFYSQDGQDAFIYTEFYREIQQVGFPKTFVDIGCNHPIKFNNSKFFEEALNFKVVAVDPLPNYVQDWKKLRPNAELYTLALGENDSSMQLLVPTDLGDPRVATHPTDMFSTFDKTRKQVAEASWTELQVQVRRTQDFVEDINMTEIGVLSIDVEGFEMSVLRGLDFTKTKVYIAIIENNSTSRLGSNEMRSYMAQNGFCLYARFWGLDDVYVNEKVFIPRER